jgi:hypothetical protein
MIVPKQKCVPYLAHTVVTGNLSSELGTFSMLINVLFIHELHQDEAHLVDEELKTSCNKNCL